MKSTVRATLTSALVDDWPAPSDADGAGGGFAAGATIQRLQWRLLRYLSAFVLLRVPGAAAQLWPLLRRDGEVPAWLSMLNVVATGSMGTVNAVVYASHEWRSVRVAWPCCTSDGARQSV